MTSKGAELEVRSVFNGLEVDYSFGYTNATFKKLMISQNNTEVNLQGNHQLFTPKITSLLAAQYSISLNRKQNLRLLLRCEWKYLGRQYFDRANTIDQSAYHTLNTRFGLTTKKVSLMFWGRNLNDAKYISYAYDFGAVHLGNPKNYGVTIKFTF